MCRRQALLMWLMLVLGLARVTLGAEFLTLPESAPSSNGGALSVSADGRFVTGWWAPEDRPICHEFFTCKEAFVWETQLGTVRSLGPATEEGRDISDDGSVVVGAPAFRWTEEDGVQNLNDLVVDFEIFLPRAVSADGNVVVGSSKTGAGEDLVRQAFVWTATGDAFQLGDLPGGHFASGAADVSADGMTVVANGSVDGIRDETRQQAFRWTAEKGIMGLGWIPGFEDSNTALAISPDGGTIVGRSWSEARASTQAFRWTKETGMVGLGFFPDQKVSIARGVSHGGRIVVGSGLPTDEFGNAFVWDSIHGIRNLEELLITEYGLANELDGWDLNIAEAISADGQTIVGSGSSPESGKTPWVVRIPELLPVKAGDANLDERFDQLDIVQVLQAAKYLTGQLATWGEGDWNGAPGLSLDDPPSGDGLFNQFDIVAALTADNYAASEQAATTSGRSEVVGMIYDSRTGALLSLHVPDERELTSILVSSRSAGFVGSPADSLDGVFDTLDESLLFKTTPGGGFASVDFGRVLAPGLGESFLLQDLSISGTWVSGAVLEGVQFVIIPEPGSLALLLMFCFLIPIFRPVKLFVPKMSSGTANPPWHDG